MTKKWEWYRVIIFSKMHKVDIEYSVIVNTTNKRLARALAANQARLHKENYETIVDAAVERTLKYF